MLQPFYRVNSVLDGKHQGAGLGLPFAKSVVELHGGTLDHRKRARVRNDGDYHPSLCLIGPLRWRCVIANGSRVDDRAGADRPGLMIHADECDCRRRSSNPCRNPPIAMACPPINEPSEIPRKRALLFQARIVARRAGNSLRKPDCCAGKNSCASSEGARRPSRRALRASSASQQQQKAEARDRRGRSRSSVSPRAGPSCARRSGCQRSPPIRRTGSPRRFPRSSSRRMSGLRRDRCTWRRAPCSIGPSGRAAGRRPCRVSRRAAWRASWRPCTVAPNATVRTYEKQAQHSEARRRPSASREPRRSASLSALRTTSDISRPDTTIASQVARRSGGALPPTSA